MRSLVESRGRWSGTFANISNLSDLKTTVKNDAQESPCSKGLRSVCWKAFLLFENLDRSTWSKTLSDSRHAYASLREHFLHDIEHPDNLSAADPLADDETSPWNTLRKDEILRAEIFQDVERCMPENLYFREPTTQSTLLDVLFIFCKLNADTGYRQGMHEILAPILWVVARDTIDPQSLSDSIENGLDTEELLRKTLDQRYMEHDTFTLFCIIMQNVKSSYEIGSSGPQSTLSSTNNSPIVERSRRIHEEYLCKADPELAAHLTTVEVLPQIFLIRWIRLLFGREFPFEDVLHLWDRLFAEDPTFSIVDYICVAMLLRIRWQLMDSDYSLALTLLLRYPMPLEPHGPTTFVADAVYLKDNLSTERGNQIITKYSGKALKKITDRDRATSPSKLRIPRNGNRVRSTDQDDASISNSPMLSPAKFLRDQGGIDGILQEAAKGVYSKGEKWGVAQVLRGAVQGLRSGNSSPQRAPDSARWSLDYSRSITTTSDQLAARIRTLEKRNKALGKMLENAIQDLWIQQKKFDNEKAEAAADALSLAIAKTQFVQVYLEDSSIPLVPETSAEAVTEEAEVSTTSILKIEGAPTGEVEEDRADPPRSVDKGSDSISSTTTKLTVTEDLSVPKPTPVVDIPNISSTKVVPPTAVSQASSQHKSNRNSGVSSPFHHPRPSLAQSSFSWMLGEDKRKSSFVSASKFPSDKRRESAARGKVGFLFGDEKPNGTEPSITKGKGENEEDDGFTLGTLKGISKGGL